MSKINIKKIIKKKGKVPITCLTAYSSSIAEILDKYCDIILVGDSLGMVLYGMKTTKKVNLDTMILHTKAVKSKTKRSIVVCDMPYKTYSNKLIAYKNAKRVINSTKCDAVKLEGGKKIINIIQYLTKKGIPVLGHVGLLPQPAKNFKIKGKNNLERKEISDQKADFPVLYVSFPSVKDNQWEEHHPMSSIMEVITLGTHALELYQVY